MNAQITLLLFLITTSIGFAQNCMADFTFGPTDLTIDFIDQSSAPNGDPIIAWDWDFGDGSGSTQQNPTHTFPDPDNYDVCLTIQTSSGCTDQLCIEIETCVLQLSVSVGDCNANNEIPLTINVSDPYDAAREINISVDGVLLPGSPFDIDDNAPVAVNATVAGDGLTHVVTVQSENVGTCAATYEFTVPDCTSDCFLSSMSTTLVGGTTHTVDVGDNFFAPQNVTIVIGDVVRFEWVGDGHSTTSDATTGPDSWNSGVIGFGSTYDVNITNPGVHGYYCLPHGGPNGQGMAGTIIGNCPPDGQFTISVGFSTSVADPQGYQLLVDGVPVAGSPFTYSGTGAQSQTISLPGDGVQHVVEIQDVADPSCTISRNFLAPNCGAAPACSLSVTAQQNGGCTTGNQIPYELTVNAINPGANGFEALIDGVAAPNGPFTYGTGGITTLIVDVPGDGASHTIVVQDVADSACSGNTSVTTTDCTIPCAITNLTASTGGSAVHTVNVEDFAFSPQSITIAAGDIVEWVWTGSVAHTATSDATSGPDSWDSGLLGQGAVYQSPALSAGVHSYYCIPHGGPGGQGMAGTITVQADCTNGQVQANLSFSASGTGVDGYEVLVDGALAGTFAYDGSGQNSTSVPVPGDGGTHTITVRDVADNSCSASTTLTTPDCNAPTCQLSLSAEETGGCNNGDITATLTVSDAGGSALGFEVQVDGASAGTFSYSGSGTTTVQIPIAGDGQPHDIQITDLEDGACMAAASLTTTDCTIPCEINDLILNTSGNPVVHTVEVQDFEFTPQQVTVAPGDTIRFLWTGAIPHTTTSDATSGSDSWDSGLLGQGAVYDVVLETLGEHPYYCVPHGAPGGIGMAGNITVEPPCNEGQVNLLATFIIMGGGNVYNVLLDDTALPAGPFPYVSGSAQSVQVAVPGDGLEHTLLVQDEQSAGCEATFTFTAPECNTTEPCGLTLAAEVTEDCDASNQVSVDMTIGHTGTTGNSFQLLVDGITHPDSPFSYAQGGVTQLSILLAGNGMMRNFEVVDSDSLDCSATTTLEVPQCGAICEIQQLSVNSSGAANHQILVEDFEFQPAVLTVAPGDTITFVWTGSIPHTTTSDATSGPDSWDSGLLGQGATYQLVLNEEGSYPYYCIPHGGPGGIGMAGTIHIEDPCNAGQGTLGVSFETTNGSALGYQVFVDGNLVAGPIAYDDPMGFNTTSITIPGDSLLHTLTVQDLEVGFCAASTTFTAPLCEVPCAILNLEANVGSGIAHIIEVRDFDFFPALTSVRVGETIRFNWTGAIPHTTTSDASNGPDSWDSGLLEQGDSFEVNIQEPGEHPYYCIPHGGPGGIGMAGMIVADPDCMEDSVQVAVMFDVTNGSAQGYNLFIDGQLNEGAPFSYANPMGTNMVFVNLPGDGQQHFITVQDLEVGFCAATTSVMVPDCSAPCSLDSLNVEFPSPALHEVLVEDFEFLPAQLDVYTGDTVRFVWTGSIPHTTTSDAANDPDSWDSGLLGQGALFDVVLNEPGSHPYYCTPHGGPGGIGMAGVLTASAPCEGDSILTTIYFSDTNAEGPFEVSLDGIFWTIINGSGSAVYLPGDGESHELIVQDANAVECADTLTFTTPMCDTDEPVFCGLSLVLDQISGCEDGMVGFDLDLSVMHTGNTGYNLFVDGILQTGSPFSYNDLPAMLTLEGDGLPHEIIVADADSTACADTVTVVTPDCSQGCLLSLDSLGVGPAVVHVVEVRDFDFLPAELEVAVGDVVRFVWTGVVPHTATSDATAGPDSWNSGLLGEGAVFEVTITTAGSHPYYCIPHGGPGGIGMAGLITAVEPCADGMLNAKVHFQSSNTGAEGFDVLIDGMLTAGSPYPYAAGGSQMAGIAIPADGQIHEVQVRDALEAECQFTTEVEMPDCSDPCLVYTAGFSAAPTNNSLEVAFTDETELNVTSWSWSFGDGTNSTAQNPVHVFPIAATYTVCLTVMDNSTGCVDMHCSEVEVNSTLCNIDFALFSNGLSVTLVDATQSTAPVQDWSWNLGNGTTISGQDSITYTYDNLGTYTICLEVLADGCSGELCQEIDLTDPCLLFAPGFTYTVNPDNPLSVQFVDLTSGMPNQWLWGFGDGMTSHQQNPAHTYSSSGTYTICLLVQDTITGCNKALCESVFVGTTGSAATEQVNYKVTIAPNPAPMGQPDWTVSGIHPADYQQDLQLFIYDLQGRLLTEGQVKGKPDLAVEAPLSASAGMYIVELRSSRRVYQGRVILQ